MKIKKEIEEYYNSGIEEERLETGVFKLERVRTQNIISRYLNLEKLNILDIGGGTGFYSFWLSEQGHKVALIDPVEKNIELAKQYQKNNNATVSRIEIGDARELNFEDNSFDLVLMFGPLYHLTKSEDRKKAFNEARRVLKKEGVLLAAAISSYASTIDGVMFDSINDNKFFEIVKTDIETGQHRNDTDKFEYFTTAFFHHPTLLEQEIQDCGLELEKVIPVEGIGAIIPDFDLKWVDKDFRNKIVELVEMTEDDKSITGITSHIMGISRKK